MNRRTHQSVSQQLTIQFAQKLIKEAFSPS